ncbi:unnamed protein product [Moneuplotes crassus]|uniref:Uncharacterized protein n=1 Tax=Euplotes crassus TaxID=5936 RepID=A0AAD2D5Y0_EUPCR|nr:unnamed protein product [Moneuplotes crassus]
MKSSLLLVFLLLGVAICSYDYAHHQTGHQLTVSLKDETDKVWVIFVEANSEGNDKIRIKNRDVKSQVKNNLYNEDVYYTELDLTEDEDKKTYKEFTDLTNLNVDMLKDGPTVVVVYDTKGYWIHGAGIPQETIDILHAFIMQKNEKDNKNQPINIGGPVNHPSSFQSFGGGFSYR